MPDIAYFPAGETVWILIGLNKPVQATVDDICIWVNATKIDTSYAFVERFNIGGRLQADRVFGSKEVAEQVHAQYMTSVFAEINISESRPTL